MSESLFEIIVKKKKKKSFDGMENLQTFCYLCYQNTELCLLSCASLCLHVL